jgi:DNA repair protein RadC
MIQLELFKEYLTQTKVTRKYLRQQPKEYKVISLRDCPTPEYMQICDTPERAVAYWKSHIKTDGHFDPERECLVILLLNTRKRVKGHHFVSTGTLDSINIHARDVFRTAIVAATHGIILMHNHPSGDPSPSEADIRVTRELIKVGNIVKIEVVDHVIIGNPDHRSLREMGYFY